MGQQGSGDATMSVQHPAAVAEYNQFFNSPAGFPGGAVFPFVQPGAASVAAPGWPAPSSKSDMQAAAARQRASARQQAKRASRSKAKSDHDDDGSDSEGEEFDEDGLDEDAMVPETKETKGTKRSKGSENDKDHKRLKRLLRNRVSAQQARERRKVYVAGMEGRNKDLEEKCAVLEQRVQTLERENFVLRQVLKSSMASAPAFPQDLPQQQAGEAHQVVPDAEVRG